MTNSSESRKVRVGVIWQGDEIWHGGQIYRENVTRILMKSSGIEPLLIVKDAEELARIGNEFSELETASIETARERVFAAFHTKQEERQRLLADYLQRFPVRVRKLWKRSAAVTDLPSHLLPPARPVREDFLRDVISRHRIDLLFPLPGVEAEDIPGVGWIADFQHRYLPAFFSQEEYQIREKTLKLTAGLREVLVSSEVCRSHFREIYPQSRAHLSVWRFCTQISDAMFALDSESVRIRYHLPDTFFLVSNQFWRHKDHGLVLEALDRLGAKGLTPVVVFTGALSDGRGTGHIDGLLQAIQERGLHEQVRILGFLSRADQIALMRRALAVIQPSRFEGWSTVVEDCRSLGQRLVLSDLAVHREQDPPAASFFPVGDAAALAEGIAAIAAEPAGVWETSRCERETTARTMMKTVESEAEEGLVAILLEAIARNRAKEA